MNQMVTEEQEIFDDIDGVLGRIREMASLAAGLRHQAADLVIGVKASISEHQKRASARGSLFAAYQSLAGANHSASEFVFDAVLRLRPGFFDAMIGRGEIERRIREIFLASENPLRGLITDAHLEIVPIAVANARGVFSEHPLRDTLCCILTLSGSSEQRLVAAFVIGISCQNDFLTAKPISTVEIYDNNLLTPGLLTLFRDRLHQEVYREGGDAIFPLKQKLEFSDPLGRSKFLKVLDLHLRSQAVFLVQYYRVSSGRRSFEALPLIDRDILFALENRAVQRYVRELAAGVVQSARETMPDVDDIQIYSVRIGQDNPVIEITIFFRGSKSVLGCTGIATAYVDLRIHHIGPTLRLDMQQLGEPRKVIVRGREPFCEVADWFLKWRRTVRDKILATRLPPQTILDKDLEGANKIIVTGARPFLVIGFDT